MGTRRKSSRPRRDRDEIETLTSRDRDETETLASRDGPSAQADSSAL